MAATGTLLSAYFIIAANSIMQHPVGYAVISLAKARETELFRRTFKVGGVAVVVGTFALVLSGHIDGQIMTKQQPMKVAAAEAIYDTQTNAGFSLFTIGSVNGLTEKSSIRIPGVASILATNSSGGKVEGINDLQTQYEKTYGPGNYVPYVPYVPVTYWSFRFMMGFGFLGCLLGLLALWRLRGGRTPGKNWLMSATVLGLFFPLAGNSFGWIFTALGRQPWIGVGQMQRSTGVSPTVSGLNVWISMIVMALLYGAVAVVEVGLIAVLWIGYFVLEGFDFGVGLLISVLGKNEAKRPVREDRPCWPSACRRVPALEPAVLQQPCLDLDPRSARSTVLGRFHCHELAKARGVGVAIVFTPIVLAYQAWSYWVFHRRLSANLIPNPERGVLDEVHAS